MTYDDRVPTELKLTQQWFAGVITQKMSSKSKIAFKAPSGVSIEEEAKLYISPSPTLQPAQRIQIYNQQYWWRLLNHMQEMFPTIVRLFGFQDFNESLAIPYLMKYCPNHWSLNTLGDRFPRWLQEEYKRSDKQLLYHAASIDLAYSNSFLVTNSHSFKPDIDLSSMLDVPLQLESSLCLYHLPYDLFSLRSQFLTNPVEHWEKHRFPKLKKAPQGKSFYFVLYRDAHFQIVYTEVREGEYLALKFFETNQSIANLCDWLTEQPPNHAIVQEAENHLQLWIQRWIAFGWLTNCIVD